MNKNVRSIAKKDIKLLLKSKKSWVTMIAVSILLCILLPAGIGFSGNYLQNIDVSKIESQKWVEMIEGNKKFTVNFLNYLMVSVFMMVAIIHSMVTATSSFVSEKERGTMETLLFSPITVKELIIGKTVASFVPALVLNYVSYLLSVVVVNLITYGAFGTIFMFNIIWFVLMLWMIPALLLFNILLNVLISAKVKSYQEAQQLGGLLVLPFVGLIISQTTGLILLNPIILWISGAVLLLLDLLILRIITKTSERNSLFETQIH